MIYSDAERAIYSCPSTGRHYDPLEVKNALLVAAAKYKGGFNGALADSRAAGGDDAEERRVRGESTLVAAARAALKLPAVDPATGNGVPSAVVMEALIAFTRYLVGKGAAAPAGPSGAPCTDCPHGR